MLRVNQQDPKAPSCTYSSLMSLKPVGIFSSGGDLKLQTAEIFRFDARRSTDGLPQMWTDTFVHMASPLPLLFWLIAPQQLHPTHTCQRTETLGDG